MNRIFEGIGRLIGYAILLAETLRSRGELADAPTLDQHCDADPVRMVAPDYWSTPLERRFADSVEQWIQETVK